MAKPKIVKSGIYRVHLKSRMAGSRTAGSSSGWGEGTMYVIGNEIRNLLLQVVSDTASPFAGADYTWEVNAAAIQPHEQLVYFVPRSLIHEVDTNQIIETAGATLMFPGQGVLSEVNVEMISGDLHFAQKVARMAIHELMHNKLDAEIHPAVPDLHKPNPLTPGTGEGLALHEVEWDTQLTPHNKSLYARYLNRRVPQYTGGVADQFYPSLAS